MIELDCLGDVCPVPAMKLEQALSDFPGQDIMLVTDHSCVFNSISAICKKKRLRFVSDEVLNGVWEIQVFASPCPQQKVSDTIFEK